LKLATWNVERPTQPRRRIALRSYIDSVDADVWVLTETHDDLVLELPHVHSSTPGRDDGINQQERWVSIWSRYPIQALSCSDPTRTAAAVVTPPDADPFIIFGSVLPWMGSAWRAHPSAGGVAFREAVACQLKDWRRFRREFPDAALFVLGDLNQDLADSHYYGSRANRAVLEAALNELGLTAVTGGSADPVRRDAGPRALIDHICALKDSGWTPNAPVRWPETPAPQRVLSDHFGVVVEFTPPVRNRGV
jgi:hypothetical protein